MSKQWWVVTPEVEWTEIIIDGQGPTYSDPDVILIEADTARDAIRLGVREMLRSSQYKYCRDQQWNEACPYTGVRAEEAEVSP